MSNIPVGVSILGGAIFASTIMGCFSVQTADAVSKEKDVEIVMEHQIRIIEPVIGAMREDASGATMLQYCGSFEDHRTRQGVASIIQCRVGDDQVGILILGRTYSPPLPVIIARFTMRFEEGKWIGSDPQDHSQPKYAFFKNGPASP